MLNRKDSPAGGQKWTRRAGCRALRRLRELRRERAEASRDRRIRRLLFGGENVVRLVRNRIRVGYESRVPSVDHLHGNPVPNVVLGLA